MAAGAALGMLSAPKSGGEVRRFLKAKTKESKENSNEAKTNDSKENGKKCSHF